MSDEARPPVRSLSEREAGTPVDDTLYEGLPDHLYEPVLTWAIDYIKFELGQRVALHRRISLGDLDYPEALVPELAGVMVGGRADEQGLLDTIDVALQLDETLHVQVAKGKETDSGRAHTRRTTELPTWIHPAEVWPGKSTRAKAVSKLDSILLDGGSTYEVWWSVPTMLTRRVDPTAKAAAEDAIRSAPPTASTLLADAWVKIYGRQPDPTTGYRQAVRAIEEVACPFFLPKEDGATLGKVVAHLRQGGAAKWAFALVDRDGTDDITPLVETLSRLWWGQVSRHGGAKKSRDQTQDEAETAVHMAATLMQWLSSEAITPRP